MELKPSKAKHDEAAKILSERRGFSSLFFRGAVLSISMDGACSCVARWAVEVDSYLVSVVEDVTVMTTFRIDKSDPLITVPPSNTETQPNPFSLLLRADRPQLSVRFKALLVMHLEGGGLRRRALWMLHAVLV